MSDLYECQKPGWVYVPPPCLAPEKHDRFACGCSFVARLTMAEQADDTGSG